MTMARPFLSISACRVAPELPDLFSEEIRIPMGTAPYIAPDGLRNRTTHAAISFAWRDHV